MTGGNNWSVNAPEIYVVQNLIGRLHFNGYCCSSQSDTAGMQWIRSEKCSNAPKPLAESASRAGPELNSSVVSSFLFSGNPEISVTSTAARFEWFTYTFMWQMLLSSSLVRSLQMFQSSELHQGLLSYFGQTFIISTAHQEIPVYGTNWELQGNREVSSWISWHWGHWPFCACVPTPTQQTLLAKSNHMPLPVCRAPLLKTFQGAPSICSSPSVRPLLFLLHH